MTTTSTPDLVVAVLELTLRAYLGDNDRPMRSRVLAAPCSADEP
jgi:hypothetical protein